jgi:hypothetical protein
VHILVPDGHPNASEDPILQNATFVNVNVSPKTRIYIDSVDTKSVGMKRTFINDSIPMGKSARVPMYLEFVDSSETVKATMKYDLDIIGGQTVTVTFPD